MKTWALSLYLVAGLAEIVGLLIAGNDLWNRIKKIRSFEVPERPAGPMAFNLHQQAIDMAALRTRQQMEEQMRDAYNEMVGALQAEQQHTSAVDDQLAKLAGVAERWWPLVLGAALVALGAAVGTVANLVALNA